jgi:hypothetical protein
MEEVGLIIHHQNGRKTWYKIYLMETNFEIDYTYKQL